MLLHFFSIILVLASIPRALAQAEAPPSSPAKPSSTIPSSSLDKTNSPSVNTIKPPSSPSLPPSLDNFKLNLNELTFTPEKNGVKILNPQVTYSVDQEEDEDIVLSDVIFNNKSFRALAGKAKDLIKNRSSSFSNEETLLYLTAPQALSNQDTIEILAENGKIVFSKKIQKENLEKGALIAKELDPKLGSSTNLKLQTHVVFSSSSFNELLLSADKKSGYRFCWSKKVDDSFSRYCTPYYRYSRREKKIVPQTQVANTKVLIDAKEFKPQGTLELNAHQSKRFLLTSVQGFSIEFKSTPLPLYLSHFFLDESEQWIYFIGHTNAPVASEIKLFPHLDPESLKVFFQWQPTIGDLRDYWVTIIPRTKTQLSLSGEGGGIFQYPLKIENIPSSKTKITLREPMKSTYSSTPVIKGTISKGAEVTAVSPSKIRLSKKSQNFLWQLHAPEKGEENTSRLNIKDASSSDTTPLTGEYSIFRGYSTEFSLRLAGALSSDYKINYLGEVAYNQWFENIFGWDHPTFSHQHWGLSIKHFKSLASKDASFVLQLTTFDLKYRFTPGLWERDESWGLILGGEDILINDLHGTFGGAGFFWVRSMPKLFDDIFNWVPFMRYPKWVDMEMIYYFAPLSSKVTTGSTPTYAINFHGKVLWAKYFFGEAGFGLKSYSYTDKSHKELVSVQALYGTMGLGFNF